MRYKYELWCVAIIGLLLPIALGGHDSKLGTFLSRPKSAHIRLMTWNIAANSIFEDPGPRGLGQSDGERPARFRRLAKAIAPDVVCLQEVYEPRNAADVAELLDQTLPPGNGNHWQAYGKGDVVIASRFPLSMQNAQSEDWGGGIPRTHAMALVDLPSAIGKDDLYVLCTHFQSHGEPKAIRARQRQADAIAAWIADLGTPGGEVDLPMRTPVVLLGDWNAYKTDPAHHMTTLLNGDIVEEDRFGRDRLPDWDDTPLRDAHPFHNATGPATYTFGDGSANEFPPAELDRILFTDSVLQMLGGFVLNTTTLKPAVLSRFGLLQDDVLLHAKDRRFDHLPVIVDFALRRR